MNSKGAQILTALALGFGLLSLFSVWNIYNWDLLGWGTQLFLFPFLAVISFLARLTPSEAPLYVRLQFGMLALHTILYFVVFNLQDPYAPNLLLLLVSLLLCSLILIYAKISTYAPTQKTYPFKAYVLRTKGLLVVSGLFYVAMGVCSYSDFLLPGVVLEVTALVLYFVLLLRRS